jgi:nitrite reductase (NO-forming)
VKAQEASSASQQFQGLHDYGMLTVSEIEDLERVQQVLVAPPFVPEHSQVASAEPKIVEVRMEITEKEMEVAPGVFVQAMTYEGSVPGPLIVVHEGDYVELTLVNLATNVLAHNIDFHAATGALGGGELTLIAPGQEVVLRFKAVKAGVFVYHCAPGGPMIPFHVVSGMNGAIMVLPRDGLKDGAGNALSYDSAFYVGEQDYYIPQDKEGNYKRYDNAALALADTLERVKNLTPSHVVFNGAVGALTGDSAMTSSVGETILLIHSQANRDTRPHLIGGHGDYVWERGNFNDAPHTGIETWFIAGGSAGAALYTFRQPGTYVYLNHNLIEAILLGAAAHINVEGTWNLGLMEQISPPSPINE